MTNETNFCYFIVFITSLKARITAFLEVFFGGAVRKRKLTFFLKVVTKHPIISKKRAVLIGGGRLFYVIVSFQQ